MQESVLYRQILIVSNDLPFLLKIGMDAAV